MYKQEQTESKKAEQPIEEENDGKPQNLLNISENFDEPEESMVSISADELSVAMQNEAQNLADQAQPSIDDELSAAIDAELKQHQ